MSPERQGPLVGPATGEARRQRPCRAAARTGSGSARRSAPAMRLLLLAAAALAAVAAAAPAPPPLSGLKPVGGLSYGALDAGAMRLPPELLDRNRRLQEGPFPENAFDRASPAGRGRGLKPGGQPDPVPGLVNPDVPLLSAKSSSMEDLVLAQGYPLESYPVETYDGFVLRVYRIPRGKRNATAPGPRPVVFLHHGVTLSSASYAVLDPASSMAFYLADAGFDVWMANSRGNTYSRGHRHYKSVESGYWDNAMDELALIDMPAQADFALKTSGQPSLAFVGHSQGCTLAVMLLAMRPQLIDKVWLLVLLGPVTHSEYIQAPYLRAQARTNSAQNLLAAGGAGGFMPNFVTSQMISGCANPNATEWCLDTINYLFYGPSAYISKWDYMRVGSTWPAGVATRNLVHWSQMFHTRNGVYMYSFGDDCSLEHLLERPYQESCNQMKYGSSTPLQYDLGRIHSGLKAAILSGAFDIMATPEDVAVLRGAWNATVVFDKQYPRTAHMDFVWARDPIMKRDILDLMWRHAPAAARG